MSPIPSLTAGHFVPASDLCLSLSPLRCTIRSECQKAQQSSPRWLTFGAGQQCIDFEQVLPDRIPVDQSVTVSHFVTRVTGRVLRAGGSVTEWCICGGRWFNRPTARGVTVGNRQL